MPEGPLGFDRKFAESILELELTFTKDTPLGRDEEFTDEFIKKINKEKLILNRDTTINVDTVGLPPDEIVKTALGFTIDEVGKLTIELANPSVIELDDYLTFMKNIKSRAFNIIAEMGLDKNKLIGADGVLRAKVNGPAGGPRPFVPSELVFEGVYENSLSREDGVEIEDIFENHTDVGRVDAKTNDNVLLVNIRQSEINANKIRAKRAIFRDIARDSNNNLKTVSVIADGEMM